MKMLYILNVAKKVNNFSYASMIAAQKCGYDFHIAGNWSYESDEERKSDELKYGIKIHQIDFIRKPYSLKNRKAYKQLLDLCKKEQFDVIHCNTPVGGLLGRLVGEKCKVKTIIYQAHGFHFYKGAPIINWLIYYPIEKWLARKTDILITINYEDYEFAKKKMRLRKDGRVAFVPGVGIDVSSFKREETIRESKRLELSLSDEDIGVISIGDLIKRKDYITSINAIHKTKNKNIKFFICGLGPHEKKIQKKINSMNLSNRVFLLGYRTDIKDLLCSMDIFLMTSRQEGIPRSLMEAMASSLPCVVSNIRGNVDLLDTTGGFLCNPVDSNGFAKSIDLLSEDIKMRQSFGMNNLSKIISFDYKVIEKEFQKEYIKLDK